MVGTRDPYKGIKHSKQMAEVFKRKSGSFEDKSKYDRKREKVVVECWDGDCKMCPSRKQCGEDLRG